MELVFKRRAMYTGLRPYFNDRELVNALKLWEAEYSEKPKFAFTSFMAEICATDTLKRKRTRILSSLLKAMELKEADLLPDPYDVLTNKYRLVEEGSGAESETMIVFARLFEDFLAKLERKYALRVRAYVIQNVEKLNMTAGSRMRLCDWVDIKSHTLVGPYDLVNLRQVINYAYIATCELMGPVKADQILSQTVAEVEVFANGKAVNLDDFL